jgi:hypothetical protein
MGKQEITRTAHAEQGAVLDVDQMRVRISYRVGAELATLPGPCFGPAAEKALQRKARGVVQIARWHETIFWLLVFSFWFTEREILGEEN